MTARFHHAESVVLQELYPSDEAGVASIAPSACLALLAVGGIGRVAVSIGAVPAVFPVHYAMLDGDVVFRTTRGTNLHGAARNAVVAFEVDDVDASYQAGWSVLVVGTADEITDDARRARAERLPLQPRPPGSAGRVMAIRPELVSGRRILMTPTSGHRGAPSRP